MSAGTAAVGVHDAVGAEEGQVPTAARIVRCTAPVETIGAYEADRAIVEAEARCGQKYVVGSSAKNTTVNPCTIPIRYPSTLAK